MLKLSFSGEDDSAKSDGCSIILQDGGFAYEKTIPLSFEKKNNKKKIIIIMLVSSCSGTVPLRKVDVKRGEGHASSQLNYVRLNDIFSF